MRYEDTPLIQTFDVGRHTTNLGLAFCGMPIEGDGRQTFYSLPACSHLDSKSIPLLVLESDSSGFQHILNTSSDFQAHELSNYSWKFLLISSHCWVSEPESVSHSNKSYVYTYVFIL